MTTEKTDPLREAIALAPTAPNISDMIARQIRNGHQPAAPPEAANRSRSGPRGGNGTNFVPGTNGNDGNERNHKASSKAGIVPEKKGPERLSEPLFEAVGAFMTRTASMPEPSWLLRDLVPDAGRLFVVSAPNAGKTFLALVIAKAAVAAGRPVFLVLEEGGARRTGDRFRNLAFDPAAPVHVAHLRGVQLGDSAVMRQLVTTLQAHEAPVLVLDPFASVFGGDENDTRAMNVARAHLDELAHANQRALLAVFHHTSKAGERGDNGPGMYAARGSSILPAWADVQINLKHEEMPKGAGRVAFTAKVEKHRDGERGQCMRVTVALGSGEVSFDEMTPSADGARSKQVLETAVAHPGLSRDALAVKVGGRKRDTIAEIDRLTGEGQLEKRGGGLMACDKSSTDERSRKGASTNRNWQEVNDSAEDSP